jgi:UDP-N-acetylglucosamine 4,6-dehydratase/5-epimerase
MHFWPENEYVVYSRDEYKQDMARQVFNRTEPPTGIHRIGQVQWILGDVRDLDRLTYAMKDVDLVIHAAAIKYIPEAEFNVDECVKVNIDGSRNVITAAIKTNVGRVVGISTDKAVAPINTYGMTKALMERLFVEANKFGSTVFTLTRYGNVVGSTGSVIPKFQQQLENTGELTLTDPNMTRYWQGVSQSVDLIKIAAHAVGGNIIIPRGASISMGKLASYLITSRGLSPDDRIKIVGIRPGEKMHESLSGKHEAPRLSATSNYYILGPESRSELIDNDFELTSKCPDRQILPSDMDRMIAEAKLVSY